MQPVFPIFPVNTCSVQVSDIHTVICIIVTLQSVFPRFLDVTVLFHTHTVFLLVSDNSVNTTVVYNSAYFLLLVTDSVSQMLCFQLVVDLPLPSG